MNTYLIKQDVSQTPARIKRILKQRDIKRSQMASELQIEKSHYYKMLNGKVAMPTDIIVMHSRYLRIDISELLVGDDSLSMYTDEKSKHSEIESLLKKLIILLGQLSENERASVSLYAVEKIARINGKD